MNDIVVLSDRRMVALRTVESAAVIAAIPDARLLGSSAGVPVVAVPHTLDVQHVLSNIGIDLGMHTPFRNYYNMPTIHGKPLRSYQVEVADFLIRSRRGFCFNPPRMGKTASVIAALGFLCQHVPGATLVVAPKSILRDVWEREVSDMFPRWRVSVLNHPNRATRLKRLEEDSDVYLVNPDSVKLLRDQLAEAAGVKFTRLVIDECSEYSSGGGRRSPDKWRALKPIADKCQYVWGLTGTPRDEEHAYGMARMVVPANCTMSSWQWKTMTMMQIGPPQLHKYVPRSGSKELVKKLLSPAIRFEKDILGLPELQYTTRHADMDAKQKDIYERMRKHMAVQVRNNGGIVTAQNAAVLSTKLMQIALGAVREENGTAVSIGMKNRLAVLDEELAGSETKVVIFAPFRATMTALADHLKDRGVLRVDGSTTGAAREAAFAAFRNDPDMKYIVLHPRIGAYGLEFAHADTVVFFGPPLNGPHIYAQAVERINSPLQQSKTPRVVHLTASPVETRLFKALEERVDIGKAITDLFKHTLEDAA